MTAVRHLELPHDAASAAVARHELLSELRQRNLPPEIVENAALVISELVGNAVLHGRPRANGELAVDWETDDGTVRIVVHDGGSHTLPHMVTARGADAVTGRGLAIVDALARGWGVERDEDGAAVWALVGRADEPRT